jgi:translation initiation factor 6
LPIFLFDTFGSGSIGVYTIVTEEIALIPKPISKAHVGKFRNWLGAEVIQTNIGGSILLGSLACANSHGMILPHFVRDEEVDVIKSSVDLDLTVMPTKRTAYGNLILANDFGAVVDTRMKSSDIKRIEDTLDVEAVPGQIARLPYVGSLAMATNKGILVHPLIADDEQKVLEEVLKVRVGAGTVNCGIPYIATGLRANSRAAVAGSLTTGPELFMIGQALDVVD